MEGIFEKPKRVRLPQEPRKARKAGRSDPCNLTDAPMRLRQGTALGGKNTKCVKCGKPIFVQLSYSVLATVLCKHDECGYENQFFVKA